MNEPFRSFRPPVELSVNYEAELNPQQLAAVTALPGPALVIAGAGSGKTRTLVYRVAFLLEQGIPPDRILLLTFTNKAAGEMMRRVRSLLGRDFPELWGGTFHSIGARVLRRHAASLGYRHDFTVLDRDDSEALIKSCMQDAEIDLKVPETPKPAVVLEVLSLALNKAVSVKSVAESWDEPVCAWVEPLERIARDYQVRKREQNLMDFDDLLCRWLELLRLKPEICEAYQSRFQFILVDEYQDTNPLQSAVIDLLAARHRNVMVVGDDAQSIYSWRGADIENLLQFCERYPGAVTYRVEQNYRSTPEILELANASLAHNTRRIDKTLVSTRAPGEKPLWIRCYDTAEQAGFVAMEMRRHLNSDIPASEIAVLYRSHFHALELQWALTNQEIPFTITSGLRFFEQAHVKDLLAYLRLSANPRDETAFKRLALMLPSVGEKSASRLWMQFSRALGSGIDHAGTPAVAAAMAATSSTVPKKAAADWAALSITMAQVGATQETAAMIRVILESGYLEYLTANYPDHERRTDELESFEEYARQFPSLDELLLRLALLAGAEAEMEAGADPEEKARLSTVHQAKGLEFRVVFVLMLCEAAFPSRRSSDELSALEEERRLFYVAVTRARDFLYLISPMCRRAKGGESTFQSTSRFIAELPETVFDSRSLC